jgi:hypothetical protein
MGSGAARSGQNRWTGNRCIFEVCGIPVHREIGDCDDWLWFVSSAGL